MPRADGAGDSKTLLVRNIPADIHRSLQAYAHAKNSTMNAAAIEAIQRFVREKRVQEAIQTYRDSLG